jgi:hypothetical protein
MRPLWAKRIRVLEAIRARTNADSAGRESRVMSTTDRPTDRRPATRSRLGRPRPPRLDDSRIRRMREDLKAAGLDKEDKEIEANGHTSYRLAIDAQHLQFDRDALARIPELEAIARRIPPGRDLPDAAR